jgi:hypothetical protein
LIGQNDITHSRTLAGMGLVSSNKTPVIYDISEEGEQDDA